MIDLLQYNFIQHALLAAILVSIAVGIIGVLVVINRLVFLSGGIVHTAYGGVGLAFFTGSTSILPITLVFTGLNAVLLGAVSLKKSEYIEIFIGLIWSFGMALGVIFMALTPGYTADLSSYLFGSILTIPMSSIYLMLAVTMIVVCYVLVNYRSLVLMAFDSDYAQSKGIKVRRIYLSLLVLVAITSVVMVQIVGIIMIIALLTMPAYLASQYAKSTSAMMIHSILWCLVFTLSGLVISYYTNLPSGATIVVVASAFLALAFLGKSIKRRFINLKSVHAF